MRCTRAHAGGTSQIERADRQERELAADVEQVHGLTARVPSAASARVLAGRSSRRAIAARQNVAVMTVDRTTDGAGPTSTA